MAWVIVIFSDQTVACVPKKWLTKRGKVKKCYFPKSGAAAKIKAAVDVDKKSGEWRLYSYRLLMNGGKVLGSLNSVQFFISYNFNRDIRNIYSCA